MRPEAVFLDIRYFIANPFGAPGYLRVGEPVMVYGSPGFPEEAARGIQNQINIIKRIPLSNWILNI